MRDDTSTKEWLISVDTGGTFTDCLAQDPDGQTTTLKVLSSGCLRVDARSLDDLTLEISALEGNPDALIGMDVMLGDGRASRIVSRDASGTRLALDSPIGCDTSPLVLDITSREEAPILAARLATGTPPGEDFPPMELRLATTRATNALLERTFVSCALFVTAGFGDLLTLGNQQRPDIFALDIIKPQPVTEHVYPIHGRLDPEGHEVVSIDANQVRQSAREALADNTTTACVSLMHSWVDDRQERHVASILREEGFDSVVISSRVAPRIGYLDRTRTSVLEGALAPIMRRFIDSIRDSIPNARLLIMTSTGSLVEPSSFFFVDGLLSGPAGGARGATDIARTHGHRLAIGFDMGGTSTDVVRIDADAELIHSHDIGGTVIARPAVAIETIAAGGGSVCDLLDGRPVVGPRSAGADPGPACYARGGPLTLTDVNLLLDRIDEGHFAIPVNRVCAQRAFRDVHTRYVEQTEESIDEDALLRLFLSIANNRMAGAIRKISTHRGFDPSAHTLIALGGAGPQHACDVADLLDIRSVIVPARASILSAHGVHTSRVSYSAEQTVLIGQETTDAELENRFRALAEELHERAPQASTREGLWVESRFVTIRYKGHDTEIELEHTSLGASRKAFVRRYAAIYSITFDSTELEIVRLRLSSTSAEHTHPGSTNKRSEEVHEHVAPDATRRLSGQNTCTIAPPHWSHHALAGGDIVLTRQSAPSPDSRDVSEVLTRELLIYKMSNIAEEMGESLRRTASSVNIRERKDYSCGVLDRDGLLVASAPHMPVHLGALGACVRLVAEELGPPQTGEIWVTNHPMFGGSHLPDITTIMPVFDRAQHHIGYVATRAHHAEIGGITPGSMPPFATSLEQEGVIIPPLRVRVEEELKLEEMVMLLRSGRYPSRLPDENIADLRAAIVASRLASDRLVELADDVGAPVLGDAMGWIIGHTATLVREALEEVVTINAAATEQLDDGSRISLRIGREGGEWTIDFSGTSEQHVENLNAPLSVTRSAIAYVMRLLVRRDVPLNDGLLEPIRVLVPEGTFLNPIFDLDPTRCPAVAAGNVETSQRVTDTLIKAIGLAACSQGTMNNLLIGNARFGYYETICGGAGATRYAPGADGVHTHMTNTGITDAEVLERRYPLRLLRFGLRAGSGGDGAHRGGDGVVRAIEFLDDAEISINAQHRRNAPFGLDRGGPGKIGCQYIERSGAERVVLEGRDGRTISRGEIIVIETPGGGGFTPANDSSRSVAGTR
ncbi:MAG: hydantoinase B/oxoprolinase family protein [Planctomycetota bacterium]|jgi:5-oxoprolinase (ATP-hydrolysing)